MADEVRCKETLTGWHCGLAEGHPGAHQFIHPHNEPYWRTSSAVASDQWQIKAFEGQQPSKYEGQYISLLTAKELERLPDGTTIISINGTEKVKGVDYIDLDTRGGRLAYGVQDD